MFQHTKHTKEKALALYKKGLSTCSIAKIVGCSSKTVWLWALKARLLRASWARNEDNIQEYYEQYEKKKLEKAHKYYKANRVKLIQIRCDYDKRYRKSLQAKQNERRKSPFIRLARSMSFGLYHSLKTQKAGCKWEKLVDYTFEELKNHLETQFRKGMSWDNYGQWHIDHIIPQSSFVFNNPNDAEFKMCWGLKNLQPLWATENFRKHNRIE